VFDLSGLDYTFSSFALPTCCYLMPLQAKCRPIDAMEQLADETSEPGRILSSLTPRFSDKALLRPDAVFESTLDFYRKWVER